MQHLGRAEWRWGCAWGCNSVGRAICQREPACIFASVLLHQQVEEWTIGDALCFVLHGAIEFRFVCRGSKAAPPWRSCPRPSPSLLRRRRSADGQLLMRGRMAARRYPTPSLQACCGLTSHLQEDHGVRAQHCPIPRLLPARALRQSNSPAGHCREGQGAGCIILASLGDEVGSPELPQARALRTWFAGVGEAPPFSRGEGLHQGRTLVAACSLGRCHASSDAQTARRFIAHLAFMFGGGRSRCGAVASYEAIASLCFVVCAPQGCNPRASTRSGLWISPSCDANRRMDHSP